MTANVIAQSMYEMCDEEGNRTLLFDAIIDHRRCLTALTKADQKFVDSRGKAQYRRSTKGWRVCVQWKDGSTSWEKLSDIKECYPVQMAEYAVKSEIADEPAFNWWVTEVLKRRDRVISKVNVWQRR